MTPGRAAGERGETLLELLVAIAILGLCVVAIAAGIVLSVRTSDLHRSQATAGTYLRSYAEAVQAAASNGYVDCASSYATPGFTEPAGYTASIEAVRYWNGSSFDASCGPDRGLQQLTLQVADARAQEQIVLVVRRP